MRLDVKVDRDLSVVVRVVKMDHDGERETLWAQQRTELGEGQSLKKEEKNVTKNEKLNGIEKMFECTLREKSI